ncbi:hypothetical protein [Actinomycetospora sp. TBRC 11914]|uniref:hypothetical protein n=1 Tax=Actinomycetospora sp. TBRC 11914 TaxID=2729387 RepID=UPI00145CDD42|nr:hypothetical protein [Actinomycetospora sp. TBRC 11914]NMO89523.1 hypothetical protein [Actinomycetospora sp. TBRC 11914]
MPLLVDLPASAELPAAVSATVGDVIGLAATGVLVPDGGVVEVLGPFLPGALDHDGRLTGAQGVPGRALLVARGPGTAVVEVIRSRGLAGPSTTTSLVVEVAAAG